MGNEKREKTLIRLEALSILNTLRANSKGLDDVSMTRYEMKNQLNLSNYKQLHDIMQYLLDKKFVDVSQEEQSGAPGKFVISYFILDEGTEFFQSVGLEFLKQFTDLEF